MTLTSRLIALLLICGSQLAYAGTDLTKLFMKVYEKHDRKLLINSHHVDLYIRINSYSPVDETNYITSLPDWFYAAQDKYRSSKKHELTNKISTLLQPDSMTAMDNQNKYINFLYIDPEKSCGELTKWIGYDECLEDVNALNAEQMANANKRLVAYNKAAEERLKKEAQNKAKALAMKDTSIQGQFRVIHEEHHLPAIQEMISLEDDKNSWTTGLALNQGFTWEQSNDVIQYMIKRVSVCWQDEFLNAANDSQIQAVLDAYESGKTQFINKKIPLLPKSLESCSLKASEFLQERIAYIIANN